MNEDLIFNTYPQISQWAGKTNGVHLLMDDKELPYIQVGEQYFYFAQHPEFAYPAYRLVMVASKDIGAEQ